MLQRAETSHRRPRPSDRPRPRPGPWLALYSAALGLRVLCAWLATGPHGLPTSHAAEYDAVAWNLARGAGFSLAGAGDPYATALVPPVVPWLTSLVYRAVGHQYFAGILLQCAIGALVPLLLAGFAASIFGGRAGRIAGWLAALHPLLVFFSGRLLTETSFTALLLIALIASAAWVKTPRGGRALGVGLTWGLASLARPAALLLPAVVAAWAWVPLGLTVPGRERMRQMTLLLLGLALVVGPWTLRNALVLHAFVPITTAGGRALLDGNNEIVWNDPARRGGAIRAANVEPYASEARGRGEPEADALARRRAWAFLSARMSEWPAMAAAKLARFWRVTAEGGWPRERSPLARALSVIDPLLAWSVLTWPFAAWGLAQTLRGPRRFFQGLGFLVVLYFTALAVVFWGALSMRVPVEPMLVLFAAVGFEDTRRRLRMRTRALRVIPGRSGGALAG
jgi:4-amino-4-deoxy-L-arabinose transferase-like glycosyltransferase